MYQQQQQQQEDSNNANGNLNDSDNDHKRSATHSTPRTTKTIPIPAWLAQGFPCHGQRQFSIKTASRIADKLPWSLLSHYQPRFTDKINHHESSSTDHHQASSTIQPSWPSMDPTSCMDQPTPAWGRALLLMVSSSLQPFTGHLAWTRVHRLSTTRYEPHPPWLFNVDKAMRQY